MHCLALLSACLSLATAANWREMASPSPSPSTVDSYQAELKQLLERMLWRAQVQRCFAVITDDLHLALYDRRYFEAAGRSPRPFYVLRVNASESLNEPPRHLELLLQSVKASDCDLVVLTLLNGWQAKQLMRFLYVSRALDMQSKFILLHDVRLFAEDMLHVWSVCVNAVFLRRQQDNSSYSISTIAFPGILNGVVVVKQLATWEVGKRIDSAIVFKDKTRNLQGAELPVAIAEHVPMVYWNRPTNRYKGVEIGIVKALAKALNFEPVYYAVNETEAGEWEQSAHSNETHLEKGLIGELQVRHQARIGIGDLHTFQSYVQHVELSAPHSVECLTFLTPESSADESWQTFILPFSGGMWAGVLLSLVVVGSIFYLISYFNALLTSSSQVSFFRCLRRKRVAKRDPLSWRRLSFRITLGRARLTDAPHRDIFDDYSNCILLTYSMLLYVALPRMPRNWPLRVLTGWYWIYCILLVATYRASFTAILANPAASITIDTLKDLSRARIPPTTGAVENKQFFVESSDDAAREVGARMEIVNNTDDLTKRIARGQCAYYDNEYYLRYLRTSGAAKGVATGALHIMRECVVHMPVVLALEKNSALKPHVNNIIQHLCEAGLISKWLRDAIIRLPAEERAPQEALMNLHKFWSSFVALGIGYLLSIAVLLVEQWHFRHVVMQHPIYNAHNPSLYYNFRRLYPDE
ncbi:ionotropic receptor 21a isoform X1 [Drosophila mojavensis]|uniref:ionotropic receptor 21a isoform X1 n=1 Tax=Drosophila mojavensis TaxID=7230 RepID=UPI0013EEBE71|nr:ionotropic receptor 21a isoform X1 [Drosophila mojavensis]